MKGSAVEDDSDSEMDDTAMCNMEDLRPEYYLLNTGKENSVLDTKVFLPYERNDYSSLPLPNIYEM